MNDLAKDDAGICLFFDQIHVIFQSHTFRRTGYLLLKYCPVIEYNLDKNTILPGYIIHYLFQR